MGSRSKVKKIKKIIKLALNSGRGGQLDENMFANHDISKEAFRAVDKARLMIERFVTIKKTRKGVF